LDKSKTTHIFVLSIKTNQNLQIMKTIQTILSAHGVEIENNKLYAFEAWTIKGVAGGQWVDTTGWETFQIFSFLNY
jgi:hypothetical protein